MDTRRILALTTALGALTVTGCGSGDSSSDSTSTPAASTSTAAPAATGGGVAIGMKNIAFTPRSVTVKVGQKITWTNQEGIDHNVVADSGADFQSDNFGEGKTFTFTPAKTGTIKYECTIHPGMTGTITVK